MSTCSSLPKAEERTSSGEGAEDGEATKMEEKGGEASQQPGEGQSEAAAEAPDQESKKEGVEEKEGEKPQGEKPQGEREKAQGEKVQGESPAKEGKHPISHH